MLHATFAGDNPPNADVENPVFYSVDSFAPSIRLSALVIATRQYMPEGLTPGSMRTW